METPQTPSTPAATPANLWASLPQKLLALSMHHLARLLVLCTGAQPSAAGSSEMALDILLIHLDLARPTRDSRPGWTRVELTDAGRELCTWLLDLALPPAPAQPCSSPTASAPTPGQPSRPAGSPQRAPLSLVHSRG